MAVQVVGDRVFVSGDFHIMNGRRRSGLASFNINSGEITPFSPT